MKYRPGKSSIRRRIKLCAGEEEKRRILFVHLRVCTKYRFFAKKYIVCFIDFLNVYCREEPSLPIKIKLNILLHLSTGLAF